MTESEAGAQSFEVISTKEHILTKDMWAGAHDPIEQERIMFDPDTGEATVARMSIAPALLVCIDEPITNAID